jgi:hypothetical protein
MMRSETIRLDENESLGDKGVGETEGIDGIQREFEIGMGECK